MLCGSMKQWWNLSQLFVADMAYNTDNSNLMHYMERKSTQSYENSLLKH